VNHAHPVLVAMAGFASHFAIDAIPHWDYPLQSISVGPGAANRRSKIDGCLFRDLTLIGFDACSGLAIAIWFFATPTTMGAILPGAFAAMLPDPLQFVHSLDPREPLRSLQRFHQWIHARQQLAWPIDATSQALFAAAASGIAIALGCNLG
jgi:hypothetical protein